MAVLGYFAGLLSDILIQRGISVTLTRKIMQVQHFFTLSFDFVGLTIEKKKSLLLTTKSVIFCSQLVLLVLGLLLSV